MQSGYSPYGYAQRTKSYIMLTPVCWSRCIIPQLVIPKTTMASPPYTTAIPNAQVPMDPEKGDTATLLPVAHPGYSSTVYLHGQPVSMMPAQDPQSQRSRDRRFCARLIHWIVLDTVFCLIILFTFKDFHKISNAVSVIFNDLTPPFDCD